MLFILLVVAITDKGIARVETFLRLFISFPSQILLLTVYVLQPVRGVQGERERLFPNRCSFNIERCLAQRRRSTPLLLAANQADIVYPSTRPT